MRMRSAFFAAAALALLAAPVADANAAEIKVIAPRAVATLLAEIGPQFERATGHKISVRAELAIAAVRLVNAGEPFDILAAAPGQIDALVKDGKLAADTRTNLVRSGIGVEVRAGAPKPDVSTVEAFKHALLAAKSIGYLKEGQSGLWVAQVIERIGLTDAVKSKLTLPETDIVSELVAKGEIELGMVNASQILTTPGVTLAGPLPGELQTYLTFAGAVGTDSKAPDAARDLIKFLKSPAAVAAMKAQGMDPG